MLLKSAKCSYLSSKPAFRHEHNGPYQPHPRQHEPVQLLQLRDIEFYASNAGCTLHHRTEKSQTNDEVLIKLNHGQHHRHLYVRHCYNFNPFSVGNSVNLFFSVETQSQKPNDTVVQLRCLETTTNSVTGHGAERHDYR
jgi:hypothetical protein